MNTARHVAGVLIATVVWTLLNTAPPSSFAADEEITLPVAPPTVTSLLPVGLRRGSTVEIALSGANLIPADSIRVSGAGVSAEISPLPEGAKANSRRVMVKLTAKADAKTGLREMRLLTPGGASNVVRFAVGELPEATEEEPNETAAQATVLDTLPVVVNGGVTRGEDRDCFRFSAKAGEQIVLDLCGQRLHPYVSRQRPGWFEGLLTVREATEIGRAADALKLVKQSAVEATRAVNAANAKVASAGKLRQNASVAKAAAGKLASAKAAVAAKYAKEFDAARALADKAASQHETANQKVLQATAAEKAAVEKAAGKKAPADKAAAEKAAAEKAAQKASAQKAAAAKVAAVKVAAGLAAKAKAAAAKAAKAKSAADKSMAEKKVADRTLAAKAGAFEKASASLTATQAVAKKATEELAAIKSREAVGGAELAQVFDRPYRNLAYSDHFSGREDPLLVFRVPKDGLYVVEVRDELYRGRAEFNYRLVVGKLPCVTSIFPAGGKRGEKSVIRLEGFNLGEMKTHAVAFAKGATTSEPQLERAHNSLGTSNPFALEVGDDQEFLESEPNDDSETATAVTAPAVMNGVIEREGDSDYFKFTAAKGQRLIFETVSRSLGSPLDARLDLYDSNGRRLKNNDDANLSADSLIDHTFAAEGEYVIRVGDTTGLGGPDRVYRLRIHPPRPDFSLTVSPDNPRVTAGGAIALKVLVKRREGFTGDIELAVLNLPKGAIASPATLMGSQVEQTISLTMPANATPGITAISVVGKTKIEEKAISHQAVPAEQVRYINAWRYVPVDDVVLAVVPAAPLSLSWDIPKIKLTAGKTVEAKIKVNRAAGFDAPVRIVMQGLPSRVAAPPVTIEAGKTDGVIEIRSSTSAPANLANAVATGAVSYKGRSFTQVSPALQIQVELVPKKAPPKKK
jgi:hypothetical protein